MMITVKLKLICVLCDIALLLYDISGEFSYTQTPLVYTYLGFTGPNQWAIVPLDRPSSVCFVSVQRDKKFVDLVNFFPVW